MVGTAARLVGLSLLTLVWSSAWAGDPHGNTRLAAGFRAGDVRAAVAAKVNGLYGNLALRVRPGDVKIGRASALPLAASDNGKAQMSRSAPFSVVVRVRAWRPLILKGSFDLSPAAILEIKDRAYANYEARRDGNAAGDWRNADAALRSRTANPSHEATAKLAYKSYEARVKGNAASDWQQAERQLRRSPSRVRLLGIIRDL